MTLNDTEWPFHGSASPAISVVAELVVIIIVIIAIIDYVYKAQNKTGKHRAFNCLVQTYVRATRQKLKIRSDESTT